MKKCSTCNREFDDSVTFCSSCGQRLANSDPQPQAPIPPVEVVYNQPAFTPNTPTDPQEPVTLGEWMVLLVQLIPCVGWLIYLIIMLTWIFGDQVKPSKRTFAKATLIIWGASIGLLLIVYLVSFSIGLSLFDYR